MALPTISFKEFLTSPITALLFMCVMALGYLYVAQTNTLEEQVEDLQKEVVLLKEDNKELNAKIIEILSEKEFEKTEIKAVFIFLISSNWFFLIYRRQF